MHLDSFPVAARSPETRRRRQACGRPARQPAVAAPAGRLRRDAAAARRTRVDDAIVSQWLLEQMRPTTATTAIEP